MEEKVTSIQQMLEYQRGQFVRLPDFAEGQPFYARLKRPSMLALVKAGKIPNELILTANRLFNGKGMDEKQESAMPDILSILDALCEATFVEPDYRQMKEAGIELTDEQLMAVFSYTQQGIKALEPFRSKSTDNGSSVNVENVYGQAVSSAGA